MIRDYNCPTRFTSSLITMKNVYFPNYWMKMIPWKSHKKSPYISHLKEWPFGEEPSEAIHVWVLFGLKFSVESPCFVNIDETMTKIARTRHSVLFLVNRKQLQHPSYEEFFHVHILVKIFRTCSFEWHCHLTHLECFIIHHKIMDFNKSSVEVDAACHPEPSTSLCSHSLYGNLESIYKTFLS